MDARRHVLGSVAHEPEPIGQGGKLLDHANFGGRFELRDDVAGLEATGEIEHPAWRASRTHLNVLRDYSQHLIVEPGVQHGFAEAPLISDLDAGQRALGHELQDRSLVNVQVGGNLTGGHQPIREFHRFCRNFPEDV